MSPVNQGQAQEGEGGAAAEWIPDPDDLNYAKRFGRLSYGDGANAYNYRQGAPHGAPYDSRYGDSVNQLGMMFDAASPEDLLPENYLSGKVRRAGANRPLTIQERYPAGELRPLSEQERGIADRYTKTLKNYSAPNAQYVLGMGIPREERAPLSMEQRREQAQQARLAREAALNQAFPTISDRIAAENIVRRQRKIKSYQKEMEAKKYFDPVTGTTKDVDEEYRMQKRALQNIGRSLKGSITDPRYARFLNQPPISGKDPDDLGDDDLEEFKALRGYSIQTVPPDQRDDLMINMYKAIGILNATPVYDGRLTTVESASKVYNPKDYLIYTVNADDNILTPGITIIRTKNDSTNSQGQYVPAGSYVAIGGWTLADASEGRSLQRLKNMMYYQTFPTRKLRAQSKFSDFTGALFGTRKDIKGDAGLKRISQMLRNLYQLNQFFVPQRVRSAKGPFMDLPTYMQLRAYRYPMFAAYGEYINQAVAVGHNEANIDAGWQGTQGWESATDNPHGNQEIVTYATIKLSTPVFNTWLSWVAKLFFNMVMLTDPTCPFKLENQDPKIQKMIDESVAVNALAHGIRGQEITNIKYEPNASKNRYDVSFTGGGNIQYGPPDPPNNWGPLPDATREDGLVQIHELWSKSYFDDAALNLILRDENVLRWIEQYCDTLESNFSGNDEDSRENRDFYTHLLRDLGHVILYYTMNSSLPDYLDDIVHESVTADNYHQMYRRYVYAYGANITFLNADQCKELLSREVQGETYTYDDFKVIKYHNVTKKLWANVVAECNLSRRCYTWVGKSFTTNPNQRVLMPTAEDYDKLAEDDGTRLANLFHEGKDLGTGEFEQVGNRGSRAAWQTDIDTNNPYTAAARAARDQDMASLIDTLSRPQAGGTTTTTTTTTAGAGAPVSRRPPRRKRRRQTEILLDENQQNGLAA